MRKGSRISKHYTEMKETWGQQGQQLLIATGKVWRDSIEGKFAFCNGYNASNSILFVTVTMHLTVHFL